MIIESGRVSRFFGRPFSSSSDKECCVSIIRLSEDIRSGELSMSPSFITESRNIENIGVGKALFNCRKHSYSTHHMIVLEYKNIIMLISTHRAYHGKVNKLEIHRLIINNVQINKISGFISVFEDKHKFGGWVRSNIKSVLLTDNINKYLELAYHNVAPGVEGSFLSEVTNRIEELMVLFFDNINALDTLHKVTIDSVRDILRDIKEELIININV